MEETTTTISAVRQEIRLRDWAEQASGMTVQRWCADNGIKERLFCY